MGEMDFNAMSHVCGQGLASGDFSDLEHFIIAFQHELKPCQHEYPWAHRIKDILLRRTAYRIVRCISCGMFRVFPMDSESFSDDPGVPWWLEGEPLDRWIRDELKQPAKGEVDWQRYHA